MPRIAGVDVPNDKQIEYSLRSIYAVGPYTSLQILKEAGIEPNVKARDLTEDEVSRIASAIDRSYQVEGAARRQVTANIARLKDIGSYRGLRHRRGLPVRGQKTRSNARTRKGPRKTVAGKKGVKEMHRGSTRGKETVSKERGPGHRPHQGDVQQHHDHYHRHER